MSEIVALPDSSLPGDTALSTGFIRWVFPNINSPVMATLQTGR